MVGQALHQGFPDGSAGKESAHNVGDLGSIPGLGRSPGEGKGYSLQYSCLENPRDRGAWWATIHGVARVIHDLVTKPPQVFICVSEVKVTQSCLILCDPMDYTVHGILQARILKWVAYPFSRGSS